MKATRFNDEDHFIKMICDADKGNHLRKIKSNTLALMMARFEKMISM